MTEQTKVPRRPRGPNKVQRPRMVSTSIRLPQYVLDHFKGSTSEMRKVLIQRVYESSHT